jgi:PTH1 family peptidyl-tRNA hydrolase
MEFMNKSGFAVQRACQFYDVSPDKLVVIHDELDLPPARLRLKSGGGHGGNNGLRSIVDQLGTRDFQRIRVGIGKPQKDTESQQSGASWVLSKFAPHEVADMDQAVDRAADAAEAIVSHGIVSAMNDFNGVTPN